MTRSVSRLLASSPFDFLCLFALKCDDVMAHRDDSEKTIRRCVLVEHPATNNRQDMAHGGNARAERRASHRIGIGRRMNRLQPLGQIPTLSSPCLEQLQVGRENGVSGGRKPRRA